MNSLYKVASRCRILMTGAGRKLLGNQNGGLPVHVTSSYRQYSQVSGRTEVFSFETQKEGAKDFLRDMTVLPCGDVVLATRVSGLRRFTKQGQPVWTKSEWQGGVPYQVQYVPAADRLCVDVGRRFSWVGLDGSKGERLCAHVKHYMTGMFCLRGEHELCMVVLDNNSFPEEKRVVALDCKRDEMIEEFAIPVSFRADCMCCLEDGTVVVGTRSGNQLQAYSPTGELQWTYGAAGSGPGQVNQPKGMCAAPGGGLFMADTGNHRVQKISARGQHVCDVITRADGLMVPKAVEMNKDGELVVVEDQGGVKVVKII